MLGTVHATGATAQVSPNRARAYLDPITTTDARAVWLNPAGLAAGMTASVYLELSVSDPGAKGRLEQVNAGFSSRGLSFAYQHDELDGVVGHTYRLGLAGGAGNLSAGAAIALYRGDANARGWDVGIRYTPLQVLTIGASVANLGTPEVRGVDQDVTFLCGVSLASPGRGLEASAHTHLATDSVLGYSFDMRLAVRGAAVFAHVETDRELGRARLALGLAIGRRDAVGAVATTPADGGPLDGMSVYGVAARSLGHR